MRLKEKKKQRIDAFLHEINTLLSTVPETPEADVGSRDSWGRVGAALWLLVKGPCQQLGPLGTLLRLTLQKTCFLGCVNLSPRGPEVALGCAGGEYRKRGPSQAPWVRALLSPFHGCICG